MTRGKDQVKSGTSRGLCKGEGKRLIISIIEKHTGTLRNNSCLEIVVSVVLFQGLKVDWNG